MKALYKNPIAIILTILAIACYIYFEKQFPAVDLSNLDPGNVIAMLGYISVIMLIVEQCIEVFIDDPDEKEKRKCKDRIADIDKYMEDIEAPIDPMMINPEEPLAEDTSVENDMMIGMVKEKKGLEDRLLKHGLKRQRRTTIVGFAIGLILSFSGLRLMSGILFSEPETEEALFNVQVTIIQSIDIILTAGIIAGGSGRMHRLIKRIKSTIGNY